MINIFESEKIDSLMLLLKNKEKADEKINIMMISTSEIRISCIIEEKYGELAVRILHKAFNMALVQVKTN